MEEEVVKMAKIIIETIIVVAIIALQLLNRKQ